MYNANVGGLINRGECITFSPIPTKLTGEQVMSMKKICKVDGCNSDYYALGLCKKHYARYRKYGGPLITKRGREMHGMRHTTEYQAWRNMKDRCTNAKSAKYHRYGGRGITVCDRWKDSFMAFYTDMGKKTFSNAEIDRKDNDGNYEPGNCHWTTAINNRQNRSTSKLSMEKAREIRRKYNTGNYTQEELSTIYGVSYASINRVLKYKAWNNI